MTEMKLAAPMIISTRLLPAVRIGDTTISIEPTGYGAEDRATCELHFDGPTFGRGLNCEGPNSGSGADWDDDETIRKMAAATCAFLLYAAESPEDGADSLFPAAVVEWARDNTDELEMAEFDLENEEDEELEADAMVCDDCLMGLVNDDYTGLSYHLNADDAAAREAVIREGLRKLGDASAGDGEGSFSWAACDCCGDTNGGTRHAVYVTE